MSGRTVDWLAKILYEAAEAQIERLDLRSVEVGSDRRWEALDERHREAVRGALETALEALGDPPLLKLHEREPIFAIRSQDATANKVVGYWIGNWIGNAESIGASPEKLDRAIMKAQRIEIWQREHPGLVKIPD